MVFLDAIKGLRSFDPDGGVGLEDVELAAAFGASLIAGYAATGGTAPQWLMEKNDELGRALVGMRRADKLRQLRTLELQGERMKPVDVRRLENAAAIAKLKDELGLTSDPKPPASQAT